MNSRNRIVSPLSILLLVFSFIAAASSDPAAIDAANRWWKQATDTVKPEKAGTVTPAHKITTSTGKVINIPRHVQTKEEEADQIDDSRWAAHERAIVKGFGTEGSTIIVLTSLAPSDTKGARELCHSVGAFIWSNDNRHFGLENIKVVGPRGEVLSSRIGLRGNVH